MGLWAQSLNSDLQLMKAHVNEGSCAVLALPPLASSIWIKHGSCVLIPPRLEHGKQLRAANVLNIYRHISVSPESRSAFGRGKETLVWNVGLVNRLIGTRWDGGTAGPGLLGVDGGSALACVNVLDNDSWNNVGRDYCCFVLIGRR